MRFTLDVHFESEAEKSAFQDNLALVKGLLTPLDHSLDNKEFLPALFARVVSLSQDSACNSEALASASASTTRGSFHKNSGRC